MENIVARKRCRKIAILLFSFWLSMEPMIVPMLQAQEAAGAPIEETVTQAAFPGTAPCKDAPKVVPTIEEIWEVEQDPGLFDRNDLEGVILPHERLLSILNILGRTREEIEENSLSEAFFTMLNSFNIMEEESHDAVSLVGNLIWLQNLRGNTLEPLGNAMEVSETSANLAMRLSALFFSKSKVAAKLMAKFSNLLLKWRGMIDPKTLECVDKAAALAGMKIYSGTKLLCGATGEEGAETAFRWLTKPVEESNTEFGVAFQYMQKTSAWIGIGFELLGIGCGLYEVFTSESFQRKHFTSWEQIKSALGIIGSVASLILMFVPYGGIVAAAIQLGFMGICYVGDLVVNQRKKWLEGYSNSFHFLLLKDEKFREFTKNHYCLDPETRSVSYEMVRREYLHALDQGLKVSTGGIVAQREINIFEERLRQGVLASYYSQKALPLKSGDLQQLRNLWKIKADYMQWQPSNEEIRQGASPVDFWYDTFEAIKQVLFPHGQSRDPLENLKESLEEFDKEFVIFNPDFFLMKVFSNQMAHTVKEPVWKKPIAKAVSVRIEQAPYSYFPLLLVDPSRLKDEEILEDAYKADCFIATIKHLHHLTWMVEGINQKLEAGCERVGNEVEKFEKAFPAIEKEREALEAFLELVPGEVPDDSTRIRVKEKLRAAGLLVGGKSSKFQTDPTQIAEEIRGKVAKLLFQRPGLIGYHAANLVTQGILMKKALDRAKIFEEVHRIHDVHLQSSQRDIATPEIRDFLKDWGKLKEDAEFLNALYGVKDPPEKEFDFVLSKFKQATDENQRLSEDFTKKFCGMVGQKKLREMIDKYDDEMRRWKEITKKWQENFPPSEGFPTEGEIAERVWGDFKMPQGVEINWPIDLEK